MAGGTAPTPTDSQIRHAIRNAKACGVRYVVIKEGLWLPGNEWRARIPGTNKNQKAWTKRLLHLQKIAVQEGASELVLGTEMRDSTTTPGDGARWRGTVAALRKADRNRKVKLTYAAHTTTELLKVDKGFVKSLDGLMTTWYPRPLDTAHLSSAALREGMERDRVKYFDPAHKRYGSKFVGFGETGYRSIDFRDYYGTKPGHRPRVDESLPAPFGRIR